MRETFYIVRGNNYQLREKEGQLVLASSSTREGIEDSLRIIVERYTDTISLYKAINKSELRVNKETVIKRQKEELALDIELNSEVDGIVVEALKRTVKKRDIIPSRKGSGNLLIKAKKKVEVVIEERPRKKKRKILNSRIKLISI